MTTLLLSLYLAIVVITHGFLLPVLIYELDELDCYYTNIIITLILSLIFPLVWWRLYRYYFGSLCVMPRINVDRRFLGWMLF